MYRVDIIFKDKDLTDSGYVVKHNTNYYNSFSEVIEKINDYKDIIRITIQLESQVNNG